MPRPSLISNKKIDTLRRAFLWGATDQEACVYAKVSTSAFYRYQAQNVEFREQKEAWKSKPILLAKKVVVEKIKSGDVKTAQWYLERKAKDEFSTREEIVSNNDTVSQILDKLEYESNYGDVSEQARKQLERQDFPF